MARPRKTPLSPGGALSAPGNFSSWAESLGEALGRGVARGISTGLSTASPFPAGRGASTSAPSVSAQAGARRRGRPPKAQAGSGLVPADRRCKVEGCGREARSKGLCSAHYQAERRRLLSNKR